MAKKRLPALRELQFGSTEARDEAIHTPRLLLDGYYDHKQVEYELASGKAWFIIGPKGSGKSAAYEHLKLRWTGRSDKRLAVWNLAGWPVADVTKVQTGVSEGDASSRAAWEFFVNLQLFEALCADRAAWPDEATQRLRKDLERLGLVGRDDLKTRFIDWKRGDYTFQLMSFGGGGAAPTTQVGLLQLSRYVREAVSRFSTATQHILAIDGLDQFFLETDSDWSALSSLVHAVYDINLSLQERGAKISVVLAIRADAFALLHSAESTKFKRHAINLNWGENFDDAGLWRMIDVKVRASFQPGFDTLEFRSVADYLATSINVGRWSDIPGYMLSYTRLLPRDLVALMLAVQAVHPGATPLTEQDARDAIKNYSQDYFVGEVSNNLAGLASPTKLVAFQEALAGLPLRIFSVDDLMQELEGEFERKDLRPLLRRLYEIGAIGMRRGSEEAAHTDFVFRRVAGGSFSFLRDYMLHDALTVAWNVPWRR